MGKEDKHNQLSFILEGIEANRENANVIYRRWLGCKAQEWSLQCVLH